MLNVIMILYGNTLIKCKSGTFRVNIRLEWKRDLHAFYSQTVQGIPNCVWEKIQRKKFLTKIDWLYFRNIQPTRLFLSLYLKMSEMEKLVEELRRWTDSTDVSVKKK